nr:hypothetical protein [Tanacetum cinerariifolium]
MEHQTDLTDIVPPTPYDLPLSRGHTPRIEEEEAKTTQDKVITRLKLRVRRLEKKRKARTLQPMKRRLFKGRVETSTKKGLGEDASKQGKNDDKTEELNLTDGADTEVLVEDKDSGEKGGNTVDQVSTAMPEVSTATLSTPPTTTTTTIFGDEDLTIAQTLIKLRSKKAKEKGVAFRDVEEPPRLTRSTTTLQPLLTIDPKDKGKGVLVEEELKKLKKVKRKDQGLAQIESDAKMDADHELAIRMTHEEKEKYTIEEWARLLVEYFERRKKHLAVERAEAIRNKPPTRTHIKNMMITYLKHMDDFVPMDSKKEEKKSVEPESKGKRIKRVAVSALKHKSSKKQKMMQEQKSTKSVEEESVDYEHEKEELRMRLIVVSDDEETVDPKILSTKYPIVDWESQILGIQDLVDLHILVMKRFKDNTSEEKRYPLIKEMLEKMLNWKLEAEAEAVSTMVFELLNFIKSQIEE